MFRNRGEVPNINTNTGEDGGYSAPHYSHYWNGRFIIIKYDKTFVAIELIATLIIVITIFAVYLFSYQNPFEDPIANVKNIFLTVQFIAIGATLITTALVTFLTKSSKEKLIRNLRIVAFISLIIMIGIGIGKLNLNRKYNEDTFEKYYEQYQQNKVENKKSNKISLGLSGVKLTSQKQAYVDESIKSYTNFSIKTTLYGIIQLVVIVVILYLSYRLSTIERKKEKLAKDDIILYDEEENIKF